MRSMSHLPCAKNPAWFRKVESRDLFVCIESDDESSDAEWPDTSRLCILLLDPSYMPRNVFDSHWILHCQSMRLALNPRFVDEYSSVCCQTCDGSTQQTS